MLENRTNIQDEINRQLADIIEYVADTVNRFAIKSLANKIKGNVSIDSHIRALLTYNEEY